MKKILILFVIIATMSSRLQAQLPNMGCVFVSIVPNVFYDENKANFEIPLFEAGPIERRTSYGLIKPPEKAVIKVEPLSDAETRVNSQWDSKIGKISTSDMFGVFKDLNAYLICGWRGDTSAIFGEKTFILTDKKITDTTLLSYGGHNINDKETNTYEIRLNSNGEPHKDPKKINFDRADSVLELKTFDALLMAFRKTGLLSPDGNSISVPLLFTGMQRRGSSLVADLTQASYSRDSAVGTVQIDFAPEVRLSFTTSDFEDIMGWMQVVAALPAKPSAEYRQRYNVQDNPQVPYLISMERRDTLLEILQKNKVALDKVYDANDTEAYDKLKKEQEIKLRIDLCNTFNEILSSMTERNISLYYRYKTTKLPKLEYAIYKASVSAFESNEKESIRNKKCGTISNKIFLLRMLKDYGKKTGYNNYGEKVEEYLIKMMNPVFKMNLTYSTGNTGISRSTPDLTTCIVTGEKITDEAFYLNYKGKTYSFCCLGCLNKFKANPAMFAR
jgi:YHS domain-containing protein